MAAAPKHRSGDGKTLTSFIGVAEHPPRTAIGARKITRDRAAWAVRRIDRVGSLAMAKMNLAESLFINSLLRVRELRRTIGPRVLASADSTGVRRVLEVGCGQGVGVELILAQFRDAEVVGIDIDAKMVERATRRLASRGDRVDVQLGDVCALPFEDGSFDVVVDFAVVHHVPDWQAALSEISRLLSPGGQFLFEDHDVTRHSLFARTFFAHPEERFTAAEFAETLTIVGIDVDDGLDDRNGHFVGKGIKRAA